MQSVLIVGSGVFGVSTAYHLLKRGYKDVTIIDRASTLPACDAASTDLNKIVRSDYSDPIYAALAKEAIEELRKPEWKGLYHESGFLLTSALDRCYASEAQSNLEQLGIRNQILPTQADVNALYPQVKPTIPDNHFNYVNHEAGWAESTECVKLMLSWCIVLGAKVVPGQSMSSIIIQDDQAKGVRTEEGKEWRADLVVLAMGSWTEGVLDESELRMPSGLLTASGQAVVVYQLEEEMRKRYATLPVIMDTGIGWYCFPPTADCKVKTAFHRPGYTKQKGNSDVTIPITTCNGEMESGPIPEQELVDIQEALRKYLPELAELNVSSTRMCWYTDTADSNWLIARHLKYRSVVFMTGGSGHGFKFLPTIGGYCVDLIEDKLDAPLARKWGWTDRLDALEGARTPEPRRNWVDATLVGASATRGG